MERAFRHGRSLARRLLYGACGLSLLACLVVFVVVPRIHVGAGTVGVHIDDEDIGTNALVDESVYFGIPFSVDGSGTVDFLSATLTGVPPGMTVVNVGGQRPDTHLGRPRYVGSESEGALRTVFPLFHLYPPGTMHIQPDAVPPGWSLIAVVKANRPGDFTSHGLDVTARQNGQTATIHVRLTITLHVMDMSHLDMSKPVHLLADCPGSEPPVPESWDTAVRRAVAAGGGEAVVTFSNGPPSYVWNTPDGSRPGQASVDAGLRPALYELDDVTINRVLAGSLPQGATTTLILGGQSGEDTEGGCSFAVDHDMRGKQFVAIFGPVLPFDRSARQPVLELRNLAAFHDGVAVTPYGPVTVGPA